MIGHDQEIERPRELGRLSVGGDDLLAFCEAIGFTRPEATTGSARIERQRGVEVRVTKKRARGKTAARVRRVGQLGGDRLRRVEGACVGGDGLLRGCRERDEKKTEGDACCFHVKAAPSFCCTAEQSSDPAFWFVLGGLRIADFHAGEGAN